MDLPLCLQSRLPQGEESTIRFGIRLLSVFKGTPAQKASNSACFSSLFRGRGSHLSELRLPRVRSAERAGADTSRREPQLKTS